MMELVFVLMLVLLKIKKILDRGDFSDNDKHLFKPKPGVEMMLFYSMALYRKARVYILLSKNRTRLKAIILFFPAGNVEVSLKTNLQRSNRE